MLLRWREERVLECEDCIWVEDDGVTACEASSAYLSLPDHERTAEHSLVVLPFASVPVCCCKAEPLLWICLLDAAVYLHVPDGSVEAVLLSAGCGDADVTCLYIAEIDHRAACKAVVALVSEHFPLLSVLRCLDDVLVELCSVFELCPDGLDLLCLSEIEFDPLLSHSAWSPECTVVVVYSKFWLEVLVIIRRYAYLALICEVLALHY